VRICRSVDGRLLADECTSDRSHSSTSGHSVSGHGPHECPGRRQELHDGNDINIPRQ